MHEMRVRHPIAYYLWYKWWLPTLLTKEERERLPHAWNESHVVSEYWTQFALYHPFSYLVVLLFQVVIKHVTTQVKLVGSFFKPPLPKDRIDDVLFEEKFVEQKSNMPSD